MKKTGLSILFIVALLSALNAQIDCKSASGILALKIAPVIINPTDTDEIGGKIIQFKGQTKLFRNPPASIPAACATAIKMYVFYSPSESELTTYTNLAQGDIRGLFNKAHVSATLTPASEPNLKNCSARLTSHNYVQGQVVFYRWAKVIDHPTDMDPVAWSDIMSFTAPAAEIKYDVELELDQVIVANVRDLDGTEDLIGKISLHAAKTTSKSNDSEKVLWEFAPGAPFSVKPGTYKINKKVSVFKGLNTEQLRNLELLIFANVLDADFPVSNLFFCQENNKADFLGRELKFIKFPTTQASINTLPADGEFHELQFGDDNTFEMNFYEKKIKNNGWTKFQFKVWVKTSN